MSRFKKTEIVCAALLTVFGLTACDVSTPSQFNLGKIQIKEGAKTATLDAAKPDAQALDAIAAGYLRNHQGPLNLTLGYVQGHPQDEVAVHHQGDLLRKEFSDRHVTDVTVAYVPVTDETSLGKAVVYYTAMNASAADGCTSLPGSTGGAALPDMDRYKVGCETQNAISQMIVDPADLMGRAGAPDGDARRQGAVVEKYKAGTPNQKLQGINASSVGSSGGQ